MTNRNIQISIPSIGDEEWHAMREPLQSGWVAQGPIVQRFEKAFAEYHNVKHALATTSCTTALHLALAAQGIGPGDEVIVPSFTWVATANAVLYCNATPVLADVDVDTYNISHTEISKKLSDKTKAIIPVHLFGRCSNIPEIREIVGKDVFVLEDAACAAGSQLNGEFAGGMGDAAAFSFHPRKSITTGEGGMVTTNDDALAAKMSSLRNHGASMSAEHRHAEAKPYLLPEFDELGFNYRMTDIQAAMGIVQLGKMDRFIEERDKIVSRYEAGLKDVKWLRLPSQPGNGRHPWQTYTCVVDPASAPKSRNEIMDFLQSKGIATRPGTHAVHMLGYYQKKMGYGDDDLPNAKFCSDQTMAIPMHNKLSDDDIDYIIDVIKSVN